MAVPDSTGNYSFTHLPAGSLFSPISDSVSSFLVSSDPGSFRVSGFLDLFMPEAACAYSEYMPVWDLKRSVADAQVGVLLLVPVRASRAGDREGR